MTERCVCYCHGDYDQIADLCDHCRPKPPYCKTEQEHATRAAQGAAALHSLIEASEAINRGGSADDWRRFREALRAAQGAAE